MKTISHLQVKSRGRINLPKQFRDTLAIEDGDIMVLAEVGNGVIIMQHKKTQVDQIANALAQQLREKGVTLKDIRKEIKKIRK